MDLVADGICQLNERCSSFDPHKLVGNEEFATAVLSATHAAMKTLDEIKLDWLRNAVLNTALAPDREGHVRETLVYLIDRLTSAHLMVLRSLSIYESKRKELERVKADAAMPFASDFPALSDNIEFANSLAFELIDLNLISMPRNLRYNSPSRPFWMKDFGHLGTGRLVITELGLQLLRHISDPLVSVDMANSSLK
jgi:hypothetical protein